MRIVFLLVLATVVVGCAPVSTPQIVGFATPEGIQLSVWLEFANWLYSELVQIICYTPPALINNPQVRQLHRQFTSLATGCILLFTIINGLSATMGWKYTPLGTIMARAILALLLNSITIPLMTFLIEIDNALVRGVVALGSAQLQIPEMQLGINQGGVLIQVLASAAFILAFMYYMAKLLLIYANRFFDLVILTVCAPFAFVAFIFDNGQPLFSKWCRALSAALLIQLVHAIYVTVFTVIMILPGPINNAFDGLMRVLLIIGALSRMASVPAWIRSLVSYDGNVITTIQQAQQGLGVQAFTRMARAATKLIKRK